MSRDSSPFLTQLNRLGESGFSCNVETKTTKIYDLNCHSGKTRGFSDEDKILFDSGLFVEETNVLLSERVRFGVLALCNSKYPES